MKGLANKKMLPFEVHKLEDTFIEQNSHFR